jgi:selenocysteine lyase/cysteine desulfurase
MKALSDFAPWYSSVHRGTGYKSQVSTYAYEKARRVVGEFVGADPAKDVVIFCKHTTEALNLAANLLETGQGEVVLTSEMEHHSNLLSWRKYHQTDYFRVDGQGRLSQEDLRAKLSQYSGRVKLVAISGASNVTGYLPDLCRIASLAHEAGALFMVDGAQLAAHRRIHMGSHGDAAHIDFVAISAHKLYAPFGSGALIGSRAFFKQGEPMLVGGGAVDIVTLDETLWNDTPDRDEAGSPNVLGAIALAAACRTLTQIGLESIAEHERALTSYALERLSGFGRVRVLGCADPSLPEDRLGVIAFNVEGIPHNLVAAVLGYEHAIGVRAGCFCAHPYLLRLLGVDAEGSRHHRESVRGGDKSRLPGAVRMSFGLYNDQSDVDAVVTALERIMAGDIRGSYIAETSSGDYLPERTRFDLARHLPAGIRTRG